jgi:phosphogluconate dehydratase
VFDAALLLGVCDKIVPGLLIGALHFGHLPCVFVPAGPMTRACRTTTRPRCASSFAQGKVGRDELLEAESAAYHGPGTCTFYGTANSNQMLLEAMGLHVPGSRLRAPARAAARGADARGRAHRAGHHAMRRANASAHRPAGRRTRASSTRWSRCWPPAAPPTT